MSKIDNIVYLIKKEFLESANLFLNLNSDVNLGNIGTIELNLNIDKNEEFGDLSCNIALIVSKKLKKKPIEIANQIAEFFNNKNNLKQDSLLKEFLSKIEVAGSGFLNLFFDKKIWQQAAKAIFLEKENFFKNSDIKKLKYLIEFVSANPTGPLHLGHGRGGIIGDVLANILNFLGHEAVREFYINDAGNQMQKLGLSFKVRCLQKLGQNIEMPEDCYAGEYLIDLAQKAVEQFGGELLEKDDNFFITYAKDLLLDIQKQDLKDYGIVFDNWFSEKTLHVNGEIEKVLKLLQDIDLVYFKDGALWFRATKFGDDKDRVVKKSSGELTYIAADIAYHKNKFDRGFDKLINVLGQDHHGYVKRLKATVAALGYDANALDVILYQMIRIKNQDLFVKMSKRTGNFTTLREVIDAVGKDVARFFYLNRKADAHLDFDLAVALKKTEENPVFYIQYAYVRTTGILKKAQECEQLQFFIDSLVNNRLKEQELLELVKFISIDEIILIKKIISLQDILMSMANTYQTHLLSYYTSELAAKFHNYYAKNKIVDLDALNISRSRLFVVVLMRTVFELSFNLLGISKIEKM